MSLLLSYNHDKTSSITVTLNNHFNVGPTSQVLNPVWVKLSWCLKRSDSFYNESKFANILFHIMIWKWSCIVQPYIMKWNESGFRPPLCTYGLNWARRTSWGWWDEWDDTVLQTQDSKFEPWRSEAEHATSRSQRLPTILSFTRGWGSNILFFSNRRDRELNPGLWRERQRC